MELLRFSTAGSVDDGKSTLIGRLLYDSKLIFEDQLEALEAASKSRGNEEVNLALLTDGLRAGRERCVGSGRSAYGDGAAHALLRAVLSDSRECHGLLAC